MAYISTEEVKEIRDQLKKEFPVKKGWKLSVRGENYTTVRVSFLKAPINLDPKNEGDYTINEYYIDEYYGDQPELVKVFKKTKEIINTVKQNENRNAEDIYADYADYNYFYFISVGKWDRPFEVSETTPEVEEKKEDDSTLVKFEKGLEYTGVSIVSDTIYQYKIIRRTDKSVWVKNAKDSKSTVERKKIYISEYNNKKEEYFYPHGQHSMCAIIGASEKVQDTTEVKEEVVVEPVQKEIDNITTNPINVESVDDKKEEIVKETKDSNIVNFFEHVSSTTALEIAHRLAINSVDKEVR
jgi:hypothetical protein